MILRNILFFSHLVAAAVTTVAGPIPTTSPPLFRRATTHITSTSTVSATSTVTVTAAHATNSAQFVNSTLFVSAILNSTNFFRREHNATAAVWNTTIAEYAASYLANDTDCTFAHSGGPYGENIIIGCSDVTSCVDAWASERRQYNFAHPGFSEQVGHFTQLVWKDSTTVGCGRRLCQGASNNEVNTGWYLVCEYWPRGNVIGEFGEEVSPQISGPMDDYESMPGKKSAGMISASVVVFVLLASAVVGDAMAVLDGS